MNKTTLVIFVVLTAELFGTSINVAQEDEGLKKARSMALELVEIRNNVFKPIEQNSDKTSKSWFTKQSRQETIVRKLNSADETTLEKTRESIARLRNRLEELEEIEELLVKLGENPNLKEDFIKNAQNETETIKEARAAELKNLSNLRMENYNKYRDKANEFADAFKTCFKTGGKSELGKTATLKFNTYDPIHGRMFSSFYQEDEQVLSVATTLHQPSVPNKELGLFMGKYPIAKITSFGYTIHVGSSEVRLLHRSKDWDQKAVEAAVSELIDFARLEKITPAI